MREGSNASAAVTGMEARQGVDTDWEQIAGGESPRSEQLFWWRRGAGRAAATAAFALESEQLSSF